MTKVYKYPHPFTTEGGYTFLSLDIAYDTYGTMNADKSNIIWVCHALTANSDVADWWPHTVEKGCFLDPEKYFTVCANFLGSHYGTTGPLSINEATGEPWYGDFPLITVRDMVRVHQLLAEYLGIPNVSNVLSVDDVKDGKVYVTASLDDRIVKMSVSLPCLISVDGDINSPRLPSFKVKQTLTEDMVKFVTFDDFADKNNGLGIMKPSNGSEAPWGEDSK